MIQLIGKDEIAERKQYRFSDKVVAKMIRRRREKEEKKKNMARIIVKIDTLDEIIPEDVIYGSNLISALNA
jgi:hypothetical protein